jgi:hypothetical protein
LKTNSDRGFKKGIHWITWMIAFLLMLTQNSCRVSYSFTGASISPDVKTIAISYFPNNASLVVPTLSRGFTDALKDYFTSQTSLVLVDRYGDLDLEGSITGYTITPQSITGNETAAQNRLTITVTVKFTNRKNEKQNFENKTFTEYSDFASNLNLLAVQDGLIKDITDRLVDDIFKQAVANW